MHSNFTTDSESITKCKNFCSATVLKSQKCFHLHRFYKLHKGHHSDELQIYIYKKNVSSKTRIAN